MQARPDAFYVGMFFYSAPESCAALTNKKASADLLPVDSKPLRKLYDGLTISYGILTATAAVTILLPTHPAIPASVLGVSVATQVAAGVTWLIYMRKLQVMFGEQPPQYLWRSVITLNVIVLLATVVTHALVISERFPKKQQDVNDPEKLPFVTARAEL